MAALTLAEAKKYLRVTGTDEDNLIEAQMAAATQFIVQCTGKTKKVDGSTEVAISEDGLMKQAILNLLAHWFENRAQQLPTSLAEVDYATKALINHIALCEVYQK